ncbi:hypothetical protein B0H11DRAFT_2049909 [Mycena galericulata]|nr:hypothetical protein B0H11DRAFT_2049909 [Mycena galericulata]
MRLTSVFFSATIRVYTLRLLICVHILALAVGISVVIDDIQFGWEPFLSERLGDVLLLVIPCIVLLHHVLAIFPTRFKLAAVDLLTTVVEIALVATTYAVQGIPGLAFGLMMPPLVAALVFRTHRGK